MYEITKIIKMKNDGISSSIIAEETGVSPMKQNKIYSKRMSKGG
jgi:hypothetical protein